EPRAGQQYQRARTVALTGHAPVPVMAASRMAAHAPVPVRGATHGAAHWAYAGETGPQAWDRLNPDFKLCALGKRQSPIHIDGSSTLLGPAEPLQFNYQPSGGSVVNNGHTLQVDVEGENTLTVRGSSYRLLQFHFHHPAEERVNQRSFAMVAHLVHRNAEGQLAVLAVLMDPGEASPLIHKVWTHLPLEVADRVRVPAGVIDLNTLLPQDQRYYQFMGSLTTPPCSEGVLWMVLKTPASLSAEQLKLFAQLFPNNARPIQALNGRVVREAQ
ncbi:MAG TPA: carbonic anhydrase family protein, partial [Burkholderiaceae bacterium]|nr:carbonic anhydrase family protein [Burkholderiaceae bacterium]